MSEITPISNNNKIKDNSESNSTPYHDLIDYCSIRKQFSRIIPNYYQNIHQNKTITQDFEQYNKIKEEIKVIEQSIVDLKSKKQKKLEQIEELRNLMRKVGTQKIIINNKKIIKNNYCNRERKENPCNKGRNFNYKNSSDKGDGISSNGLTLSGLSSGEDDDAGYEDGYQCNDRSRFNNNFSNSSNFLCHVEEDYNMGNKVHLPMPEDDVLLHKIDN
jgi:hypothetical protein